MTPWYEERLRIGRCATFSCEASAAPDRVPPAPTPTIAIDAYFTSDELLAAVRQPPAIPGWIRRWLRQTKRQADNRAAKHRRKRGRR